MSHHLSLGDRAAQLGDFSAAITHYAAAVPNTDGAYERLCQATASFGRRDEALACCKTALAVLPSSAFLHSLDAQESAAAGNVIHAAAAFGRADALAGATPDASVRLNWGITLSAAGRSAEAVVRLESAVALTPNEAVGYTELARALEHSSRSSTHARAYAARLLPSSAEAHLEHGNALLADRRASEAAEAMRRAIVLSPPATGLAHAYYGLAQARLVMHDACGAREALRRAARLSPRDSDLHHRHGVAAMRCSRAGGRGGGRANDRTPADEAAKLRREAEAAWNRALAFGHRR